MFKFFLKFFFVWVLLISPSFSDTFNEILIEGNERISDESVKIFSDIPSNNTLDDNSLNLILKNLYETGFFKDVSLKIIRNKLLINVVENPIIQTVFIDGVKSKSIEAEIEDLLSLRDRSSFIINKVKKDETSIINLLKARGYYFAKIESSIEELDNNKVNLTYLVDVGKKARLSKITFIGNKKFKDSKLRKIIVSEEYKFWKFISGKKYLNEDFVNFDKRLLYNFYKNNGYYNVKIKSSFANYLGGSEFELIFNIDADKKYYFNEMLLDLPSDYDPSNFKKLNDIFVNLKGKVYSLNSINKILKEIDKISLNKQYEFLSSTVIENINDNLIDFDFKIEESE